MVFWDVFLVPEIICHINYGNHPNLLSPSPASGFDRRALSLLSLSTFSWLEIRPLRPRDSPRSETVEYFGQRKLRAQNRCVPNLVVSILSKFQLIQIQIKQLKQIEQLYLCCPEAAQPYSGRKVGCGFCRL
jgi:hypothetical protein